MKEVSEEYTQNVAAPTKGFDCHTCKEFSTVISNTSSFLAFQRTQVRGCNCAFPLRPRVMCTTLRRPWSIGICVPPRSCKHSILFSFQCYLYEFRGDGSDETVQCPSAACVYAIVSFLYVDPKLTLVTAEYKRYTKY